MIAQAVVVLPHAAHISLWIIAVGLFCGYWRWMVYQGRWDYPQRWVKVLLVIASAIGVAVSGKSAFSLETATGLLIVAFALKLVEMKSRRDAYLVIHLCYFIVAAEFLFDQSIGVALYERACRWSIVTAALVGLHQLHTRVRASTSLRTAAVLVVQAMPLMLVLFLFFPRVAPLWSVPLPGGARHRHQRSRRAWRYRSADAFRTRSRFAPYSTAEMPPARALVLARAGVFELLRKATWSVGGVPSAPENAPVSGGRSSDFLPDVCRYRTRSRIRFCWNRRRRHGCSGSTLRCRSTRGTSLTRDFRLIADEPMHTMVRYRAVAYPRRRWTLQLPDWLRARETQLPDDDNPRIVAFANDLAGTQRRQRAISRQRACSTFATEPYVYTLEPAAARNANSVDAFWFDTRRGFCSALCRRVRLSGARSGHSRADGRRISGWRSQPADGHLVVRQFDAHAWAEVWLEGRGWVRFDPTAAVAPARIESRIERSAVGSGSRGVVARSAARASKAYPACATWCTCSSRMRSSLELVGGRIRHGSFRRVISPICWER